MTPARLEGMHYCARTRSPRPHRRFFFFAWLSCVLLWSSHRNRGGGEMRRSRVRAPSTSPFQAQQLVTAAA